MSPEQIKEKYGIEPIMKEMWVWNNHVKDAELMFVSIKDSAGDYQYCCYNTNKGFYGKKNASETNPNDKEPKVGDKGYFWRETDSYLFGKLLEIDNANLPYQASGGLWYEHFSHEKQPWMK
jgi:hypothetical protein